MAKQPVPHEEDQNRKRLKELKQLPRPYTPHEVKEAIDRILDDLDIK